MSEQPKSPESNTLSSTVGAGPWPMPELAAQALSYWVDSWQRSVLFWDVLRERGNIFLEHEKEGKPPVLVFEYEIVVDGRQLEQPANYALVRIKPPAEHPTDPQKRPFVVIDPRAGHGPGIGGSKLDSEIGMALRAGHPCYFVMFFPKPVPGQTIEAVAGAEAVFLTAQGLRALQSSRLQRYLLSDPNPAMWTVKTLAQLVRAQRQPAVADNPFVQAEHQVSDAIERSLDQYRDTRDAWQERIFQAIYESPWLAALVGLTGKTDPQRAPKPAKKLREELKRLKLQELQSQLEAGSVLDAWIRVQLYQGFEEQVFDERPFRLVQQLIEKLPEAERPTIDQFKEAVKRQMFTLLLDKERAVNALPRLLPEMQQRRQVLKFARLIATAKAGQLSAAQERRFQRLEEILGITESKE